MVKKSYDDDNWLWLKNQEEDDWNLWLNVKTGEIEIGTMHLSSATYQLELEDIDALIDKLLLLRHINRRSEDDTRHD